MATNKNDIKIAINYTPNSKDSNIDYEQSTFSNLNNISNVEGLSKDSSNLKPFILGFSKLDSSCSYANEYNGIIAKQTSDIYSSCSCSFRIAGKNMKYIVLQFDSFYGYATKLTINNREYTNDSIIFALEFATSQNTINVSISRWSKPSSLIVIDKIALEIKEEYTTSQFSNLTFGKEVSSSDSTASFGVVGRYGSFNLEDKSNKIRIYLNNGLLTKDTKIEIYYHDTSLGRFTSNNWEIQEASYKFKVELVDKTSKFTEIKIPKIRYQSNVSAYALINLIFTKYFPTNYKMSKEVEDRLKNIIIKDFYTTETKTLQSLLNDFCSLTLTNIFVNNNDEMEIINYV